MKQTFVITAAVIAVIVALAFSTLAVLVARAGQQHGLDCAQAAHVCAN